MSINDRIKDISTIRNWLREFSLFGDKTRADFTDMSGYRHVLEKAEQILRTNLLQKRDTQNYQHVYLSMDARDIDRNPLFDFYRIHSFKTNDLKLHFLILDCLSDGKMKNRNEILSFIYKREVYPVDDDMTSTLHRKLEEYLKLGILRFQMQNRQKLYGLNKTELDLVRWREAIQFYSEIDPLGVIGDFLRSRIDRMKQLPSTVPFLFRHHYLHHVLDAEIVETISDAMLHRQSIYIINNARHGKSKDSATSCEMIPIQFYHSVQSGRRYLACTPVSGFRMSFIRLDRIQSVKPGNAFPDYQTYYDKAIQRLKHVWGVSEMCLKKLTHLEMTIHVPDENDYTIKRIDAEKRHGYVEYIDKHTAKFIIDVWEVREMLPWVRTFIGYIVELKCSNQSFVDQFKHDLREAYRLYQDQI